MYKYKYFFRIFLLFVEPKRAEWGASCSYFICPHARTHLHLAYTFSASVYVSASICLSVSTRRSANTRSFRDLLGRRSVRGCSSLGSEVELGSERASARVCVGEEGRGLAWRGAESCAVDWSVSVIEGKKKREEGSCVPAHSVRALQRQGLGLVGRGGAGGAAEGRAVGGRGVTRRVRVLSIEL